MKRWWRWWLALTSQRERGTVLAVFRIAVATVMATTLLTIVAAGLVDVLFIDRAHGGLRVAATGFWLLRVLGGPKPEVVWPLIALALAACGAMALGIGGRWSILVAVWCYRSVSSIGTAAGGYDSVIFNAGWLLFLSQSTTTLSWDCKRRTGRWTCDDEVPAWPRYLAVLQLVIVYTATGLMKTSASWTFADGYSALYWFLQDPNWVRFDMGWTSSVYPLTQLATALVWHFEVLAPLILLVLHYRATPDRPGRLRRWFNRFDLRIPWIAFGITLHLGIFILMDVGPFSWITMSYYACLFTPAELESLARRLPFAPPIVAPSSPLA